MVRVPSAAQITRRSKITCSPISRATTVENDIFTADTPEGKFPVHNIIAKFPGTKDGIIVIASHYDTNYPLRNTSFVGANDGGSSSGLLLEIANQLRGKTREGHSIWLVWDDAEEAIKPDGSGGLRQEMPFEQTAFTALRTWRKNGRPMARLREFEHSCWPT